MTESKRTSPTWRRYLLVAVCVAVGGLYAALQVDRGPAMGPLDDGFWDLTSPPAIDYILLGHAPPPTALIAAITLGALAGWAAAAGMCWLAGRRRRRRVGAVHES